MNSHCFKHYWSSSILFNFLKLAKLSRIESKSLEKEKENFCWFCFCFVIAFSPFLLLSILSSVKLPNVVIQKFCYHGNVTTHFSSLLRESLLWYKIPWAYKYTLKEKSTTHKTVILLLKQKKIRLIMGLKNQISIQKSPIFFSDNYPSGG